MIGRRPRLTKRRVAWLVGWSALAVVGIGILWLVVSSMIARSRLSELRAELPQLREAISQGQFDRAQALAHRIEDHAHAARELTTGPVWWVAANVPVLGTPLRTGRVVSAETDRLAQQVIPSVLDLAHGLTQGTLVAKDTVDLATLRRLAPQLAAAARAARLATEHVEASPASWSQPVADARTQFVSELRQLRGELSGADRAVRLLQPMLGESGPKRYFVGFLNEAESRGVGGLPGAFAIVTADHGHIVFRHFGSDVELASVRARASLGRDFDARYRQDDPQGVIANSDISPEFSYAARIWAGMWQAKTGQRIDGALAVDPTALSYLLRVTGPATLPGGEQVSAGNVVGLTQQWQYAKYPAYTPQGNLARKKYLTSIAEAASARITAGGDPTQLVGALTQSARERRLVVWSADPQVQHELDVAGWSGSVQPADGARAGFVVVNAAGSKLDYYLGRSMTWTQSQCGQSSSAVATLRLRNDAPTKGLPPYVTIRADQQRGAKPGDNRLLVSFYAPAGARIVDVRLDGRPVRFGVQTEAGSIVTTLDVELPRQSARTISVTATGAVFADRVGVLEQPLVQPIQVSTRRGGC
ncbi:MAG TPA: DUF4012 domain-containing protein [Jatrophihabitans sp.]|nr:DUF4012 domain-containing protein [Jatrophihabitans sp.]